MYSHVETGQKVKMEIPSMTCFKEAMTSYTFLVPDPGNSI